MVQLRRFTFMACVALVMAAVTPAVADEYVTNFGPVEPNEPILASVGGKRIIAFFVPERRSCADVTSLIYNVYFCSLAC
jgi:hypothetical protein